MTSTRFASGNTHSWHCNIPGAGTRGASLKGQAERESRQIWRRRGGGARNRLASPREERSFIDHVEVDTPRHASDHLTHFETSSRATRLQAFGSSVSAGPDRRPMLMPSTCVEHLCCVRHTQLFDCSTIQRALCSSDPPSLGASI